jgi:predicted nucleic acid-binding protein
MKHVFIDTNVMVDYLANRTPFAKDAILLLTLGKQKRIRLYISSLCYYQLSYILRNQRTKHETLLVLKDIYSWTDCLPVTSDIIKQSLHSNFTDFEDAIQHFIAHNHRSIHCIVTRNKRDFTTSQLPVLSPKECISWLN